MRITLLLFLFTTSLFTSTTLQAQEIDDSQLGGWYMYFWNTTFKESRFGAQGDVQYRDWKLAGDLEQILVRGGLTYSPTNANIKFTAGLAHITTGSFGESSDTFAEIRGYQEALLPHKLTDRFYITHRFRYEQRWVENQDFRTRFRYNLFLNVPLNQPNLLKDAIYLAFYNELFINGERSIGSGRSVELFDRNRFYSALGYSLSDNLRIQVGYMEQTTNTFSKGQFQLSLHHTF